MSGHQETTVKSGLWSGELWGGLAAMLVALPSAIAFGVLVYTTLGPEYADEGAMAGMLGAAALGVVAPIFGRTGGLISAPCAPAAAVMVALVAGLMAKAAGPGLEPAKILPLMALTALIAAGLQVFYGVIGGGRLIKYIPYPVVTGYLSGVGVLIALGQLPKLFGLPEGIVLSAGLMSPSLWRWQGLVVGIVTVAAVVAAPYFTQRIPAAIIGLLGGIAAYFVIAMLVPGLLDARNNPLIIGPIEASGSFLNAAAGRATSLFSLSFGDIRLILIPALTLSVLLSIDTLKTCVVLDAMTRSRHNSNRELMGQGIGNLASFLVGGMPGAGTMGPTLVNVTSGGRRYFSGVAAGTFAVLTFLLFGGLIAWVPIGALAAILLVVAWRMFDWNMFRLLRHPSTRLDFAVIAGVIAVAVTVDLIAASMVGVALAIFLFIRDQIQGSVIRRRRYLTEVSSKTRRLISERAILDQRGDLGLFCELQGNLFFGTTDQLLTKLADDLRTAQYILLDLRRVQSMDYTAAHLFEQVQACLEDRGGKLLISGLPSSLPSRQDIEVYLSHLGLVKESGGIRISETLDGALEWMEERILDEANVDCKREDWPLGMTDIDLFKGLDRDALAKLEQCMSEVSIDSGDQVFSQGDEGDEIFVIRRGSVRILLDLKGGKRHHLATFGRGDFFGELAFLDREIRSADADAKVQTDLFVFSRARFDDCVGDDPALGNLLFSRLARAIAQRLRQTDAELRALEDR